MARIEQTFKADIMGVGEITAGEINLPGAVELHGRGEEVYPGTKAAAEKVVTFIVPLSLENLRHLGAGLYKTAKVTIIIETEESV